MTSPYDPLKRRLRDAKLYLVCDAMPGGRDLDPFLASVLEAGVDIVQLRDKHAEVPAVMRAAEVFRVRSQEAGALFVVNDRVDVALAVGADAVHLGQDDLTPVHARRLAGDSLLIGLSTHSPDQIADAQETDVDYIAVGPIFETPTKPGRAAVGLQVVKHASSSASRPWFPIGGINLENLGEVIQAGASRVAVVRAITEAEDPAAVIKQMRSMLDGG